MLYLDATSHRLAGVERRLLEILKINWRINSKISLDSWLKTHRQHVGVSGRYWI